MSDSKNISDARHHIALPYLLKIRRTNQPYVEIEYSTKHGRRHACGTLDGSHGSIRSHGECDGGLGRTVFSRANVLRHRTYELAKRSTVAKND